MFDPEPSFEALSFARVLEYAALYFKRPNQKKKKKTKQKRPFDPYVT